MPNSVRLQLLASVSFLGVACPAFAEDVQDQGDTVARDEIVVEARFREETIQDIGASVAALSSDDMDDLGVRDFDDVAQIVAGVQNIKSQQNANNIAIRGVIDAKPDALYATSSVYSIFLDDVSVAAPGLQRDYSAVDLSRVEIIRGPQPTLFGEGAVGGVIRYFTTDPDLDGLAVTGYARGRLETIKDGGLAYSGEDATSFILAPGKLGVRLSGFYRKDEGFIDNPTVGEDVNDFDTVGGRAVILAQPTDELEIRLAAFLMRDELGESTQVDPGSDPKALIFSVSPFSGVFEDDFDLYSGRISYDFGTIKATSITGYYERNNSEARFSASNTFGLAAFFASDTPGTSIDTTTTQIVGREQQQFSQEFRFVSDFDGPVNFASGFYYRDKDIAENINIDCPGCAVVLSPSTSLLLDQFSTTESEQFSGFLELTLSLSERLRLIGGARYLNDKVITTLVKNDAVAISPLGIPYTESSPAPIVSILDAFAANNLGNEFEFELSRFLPRGGIEFDITDNVLFYANAAVGARNGGVGQALAAFGNSTDPMTGVTDINAFREQLTFDEDNVLTIEGGVKTTLLDGDMTANLGVFHSRFKDTQILQQLAASNVINGPDQRIYGLELETAYNVNDNLMTFFNAAVLESEFLDGFATTPLPILDVAEGNEAPYSPKLSLSTGYNFSHPLNAEWSITSSGVFQFIGKRHTAVQNYPSTRLDSLENLNLRIGFESERIAVNLFATNVLNDIEAVRMDGNTVIQAFNADGVLDAPPTSASVNRPRTYGVSLTLNY